MPEKKNPEPESGAPHLKDAFFDLDLGPSAQAQEIYRAPTLMRTTEWGGLTVVSLLSAFLFPPYFTVVLVLACLNAGGLLWVTHLSERGRKRLVDFEALFREGYALEEKKRWKEAAAFYESLVPSFQEFPKIAEIARSRIQYLWAQHPEAFAARKGGKKAVPSGSSGRPARRGRS